MKMPVQHTESAQLINKSVFMKKKHISLIMSILVILTLVLQYLNGNGEYTTIMYLLLLLVLIILFFSILRKEK